MALRRFFAAVAMCLFLPPALAADAGTALTQALGIQTPPWIKVQGSNPARLQMTLNKADAFGLKGLAVNRLSVAVGVDGKPTGAITADLTVGGQAASGTLGSKGDGAGLEEVWLELGAALNAGTLVGGMPKGLDNLHLSRPRLGYRPGTKLAYVSGQGASQGTPAWSGNAVVTTANTRVTVFVQTGEVDLQKLVNPKSPTRLPTLRQPVLVFNSGTGAVATARLADQPQPVQQMFSRLAEGLKLPDSFPVGQGLGIWSKVSARDLGIHKDSPLRLPDMLLGGEFTAESLALAAALDGTALRLANWKFRDSSFYFSYRSAEGLQLGVDASIDVPLDGQEAQAFKGKLAIETQTGALAMTGTLEKPWVNPLTLQGASLKQGSGITMSIDTNSSLGLGVQGGLAVNGATAFKNTLLCINATLGTGVPVIDAAGLRFEADTLDPAVVLRLVNGLVQFAANSPAGSAMSKLASGGQPIGALKGKVVGEALTGVPLPTVDRARFYLVTPGLTCDLPANAGMGAALAGAVSFMGQLLAATDSGFNLDKGFWLGGNIQSFNFGNVFSLNSAKVDVAAPMPTSPENIASTRFRINGGAKLAFAEGDLVVNFSKDGVRFDADAALSDFFKARLQAASVGARGNPTATLADTADFKLSLAASADTAALRKEILKGLAVALQPKARTRRAEANAKRPSQKALADAQAEADKLNKDVGEAYRGLLQVVSNAEACLQGSDPACRRLAGGAAKAAEELASAADRLKAMAGDIERWGRAEAKWATLAAAEQAGKASEDLWNGFLTQLENVVKDVSGAASIVSVDRVAFDGLLRQGNGTLAVDVKLDPRPINAALAPTVLNQKFAVNLGKSVAPSSGKGGGYDTLSDAVATGYAGLRPPETVPRLPTATALSWEGKDGLFTLTAKVASDLVRQESGGAIQPGGTLTLYRVGKDDKRVKVASSTELNQKGNCNNATNVVRFPAPAGSGCSTRAEDGGAYVLKLEPGTNIFQAEYQGDGAYAGSTSKSIVILVDAACGALKNLAGATVRIARPKAAGGDAFDYVSTPNVLNAELGNNAQLYFLDKKLHASTTAGRLPMWDLVLRLRQVPGSASQYYIETVRDCSAAPAGYCTRLGAPTAGDPMLLYLRRTSTEHAWTLTNTGKAQFQFSTNTGCPKGAATCYLGSNNKATAVGEPNSPKTLGDLVLQAAPTNLLLEEVCTGK
ncbi:MAG: hypothetical protein JNN03_22785 [Rubrivivax sp.]|nr:hypothetical protein [Rubrivivax sp.]